MLTKSVKVGKVQIGGGAPISIQSMLNCKTTDVEGCYAQTCALQQAGCQIVRLAVPDMESAKAFGLLKKKVDIPLVADIHFDYRLALAAIEEGADKVRINPGNIGSEENVRLVLEKAKAYKVPIRIGVNSGSLEKDLLAKYGGVCPQAVCESALNAAKYAQSFGFEDIVISLKCSDVKTNFEACKLFREKSDLPLHIGLTEAGIGKAAEIKSSAALGALLLNGIGDTMRVSLTGDPVKEVILAKEILKACGVRKSGIDFVSCPTCARTKTDMEKIALEVENALAKKSEKLATEGKFLRVAVMGCEVNGPGEAKEADYGVACGKGRGAIFKKGEIITTVPESDIAKTLLNLID